MSDDKERLKMEFGGKEERCGNLRQAFRSGIEKWRSSSTK